MSGLKLNRGLKLREADKEALLKVKLLLDSKLEQTPTIEDLCRKSGMNEDKLKKGFKQLYGQGPFGYHLNLKMEKAKDLLLHSENSVNEIAFALGYEHASSICNIFKEVVGLTAGEWRANKIE